MNPRDDTAKNTEQESSQANPEGQTQDQDPGHAQKQNQSDKKEDDLAA